MGTLTSFSNICVRADRVEVARKFVGSVISPPLSTGVISDILRGFGVIPGEGSKLKSLVWSSLIKLHANLWGVPINELLRFSPINAT